MHIIFTLLSRVKLDNIFDNFFFDKTDYSHERKRRFVGFGELALVFSVSSFLLNFFGLFTLLTLSTRSFLLGMVAVLGKIGLPPGPKQHYET